MEEEIKNLPLKEKLKRLNEFPVAERLEILKQDMERIKEEKKIKEKYMAVIQEHKDLTWEEKHPRLAAIRRRFGGNNSQFKF